ncbi:hypothetical protein ACFYT4_15390 [Streptomyces sp. NPDC004609]|uniref:hypothetical protein n=1 Tax=Streptomyces sp. NPDC004609 TaxID=3364704 RepID=UPI0036BE0612
MAYGNTPPGWSGWAPPPPPKPGVIPLRPLDLNELLGGTFATIGRYWKPLFGIVAAVYLAATALLSAVAVILYRQVEESADALIALEGRDPVWDDFRPLVTALTVFGAAGVVVMLLTTALVSAVCQSALQDAVLGRRTTAGTVWGRAWARFPAVLGTVVLTGLLYLIPVGLFMTAYVSLLITLATDSGGTVALLLVTVIAGLIAIPLCTWLWVRFSLSPAVAVFERQGAVASMRRSAKLVGGSWWRVLGITLLAGVIAGTAGYVIQMPLSFMTMVPGVVDTSELGSEPTFSQIVSALSGVVILLVLGQLISQILITVFPQLVVGMLYIDQRIRRENLAPALAEAAGPQPPGPVRPGPSGA